MSDRPYLKPKKVMDLVALSASADAYSDPTNINRVSICSYTIVWTGTPTGSFVVEVCNDYVPTPPRLDNTGAQAGNWVALTLSTTITTGGAAGSAFADIDTCGAAWIRLRYVHTSGTGTATATIAGKVA